MRRLDRAIASIIRRGPVWAMRWISGDGYLKEIHDLDREYLIDMARSWGLKIVDDSGLFADDVYAELVT